MMISSSSRRSGLTCLAVLLLAACGDDAAQSAIPSVPAPAPTAVNLSFDSAPTSIVLGQSSLLGWRADNATACIASGSWTGSRPVTGSESVTPTALGALTYTLNCTGEGLPATRSVTITVTSLPAIADVALTIGAAPLTLELGSPVRLTWNAANADACTASGAWSGDKATSGNESVTPVMTGPVIYRLNCTGAGAPDVQQVTVTVTDPHAEALSEFLRLRALENNP